MRLKKRIFGIMREPCVVGFLDHIWISSPGMNPDLVNTLRTNMLSQ